jgi:hypothetical protein
VKRRPFFLDALEDGLILPSTTVSRVIDERHLVLDHPTISRFKWLHNLAISLSISVTWRSFGTLALRIECPFHLANTD